ncbi:MAG TPA: fasciclin domain-containing protein [Lysobacter sp.]|nr:fasciclin domain-containing protein [Lysobacter sp.]
MKTSLLAIALLSALALAACSPSTDTDTAADTTAMTDDATMPPVTEPAAEPLVGDAASGDVVDNAINSPDHTTLVAAIKAADLVDTLKGAGPFTVFAPTNAAFDALPSGTVDTLLQPENKGDLTQILTYHVVPGSLDAATLTEQIQAGNGSTTLTTVEGGTLTVKADANGVTVTDAKGNVANVTTADLMASNGVIHVVDKVLMP